MEREIVLCPSKAADGKQCEFELISRYKRCPICEVRVDQAWFQSETQTKLPDKHLDSNGETSTSVRTDLGNPVAQNEDHSPNVDTETTDRGEKDKNDNGKTTEDDGVKDKGSVEDLRREGGEGVRDERRDDGNRKRKKEEEDEGGGLRSKEIRKENVDDTEKKGDMKDGEEGKREDTGHNEKIKERKTEEGGKENGSRGETGQEKEDQRSARVGKGDGDGNRTEKEDNVAGREKQEVGNGKKRDEGEDEEGRSRSDPLLRSSANGSTSTSDPLLAIPKNTVQEDKNQKNEENAPTSQKTGQHTDDSTAKKTKETVKVCFRAFLSPTVDFNPSRDELYVVFGSERNDWNCTQEGLMKFGRSNSNKNDTKDGIPVFAEVELEKILLRKPGLSYRYCFCRKGNKSIETEFFFQQYYPYHNNCRMLTVPPHFDYYRQCDGYIYAKKKGFFKEKFSLSKKTMLETMKRDGEDALRQYLPDICCAMHDQNQSPGRLIMMFNEYCQVFQGGVKDHFMLMRTQNTPVLWQEFIMNDHLKHAMEALDNQANKLDENGRLLKALLVVKLLVELNIHIDFLSPGTVEIIHLSLLLSPDTERNKCPQLDFLDACLDASLKKNIRQRLILFLKASARRTECKTERNPSWIMCLPIIHYLDDSLHPFQRLDYCNFKDTEKVWWLISELEQEKEDLKTFTWSRPPLELMHLMKPLFKLDTKTQRGFMACLKLDDLEMPLMEETILLEIKLATMLYYFKVCRYEHEYQMARLQNCIRIVYAIFKEQLIQLSDVTKRDWKEVDERYKIQESKCMAMLSLGLQKMTTMSDKRDLVSLYHSDMILLAVLDLFSKESDELKSLERRSMYLMDDIFSAIKKDFGIFDFALSIMQIVKKNDITNEWERKCLKHAKDMFEKMNTWKRLEFFSKYMEQLQNESLRNMMQEVVMENINDILQDSLCYSFFNERLWLMDSNSRILSKLFTQMWYMNSNSEGNASDNEIVGQALSSQIYPKCVEAYLLDNRGIIANMDETAQYKLWRSVMLMGSLFQDISKNTITIELLELIIAKKATFLAVAKVFEEHQEASLPLTTHALEKTLSCREKDLKTLEEVLATVRTLLYFLKEIRDHSNIKIQEIDEKTLKSWKSLKIGEVCCINEEDEGSSQYQSEVVLYKDLLSKLNFIVKNIFRYDESKTFHKILKRNARMQKKTADLKFDDVIEIILGPTKNTWDELCSKIKEGSISVREIEKYCFNEFNKDELYKELVAMNGGRKEDWIKDRITQLQRFQMFSKTVSVAKLLLNVRDEYEINGPFENLELIAKSDTEKDVSLIELKISIQEFNQELEEINENQKESIASFYKASDLVKWMRIALPGGIKDLKIYADLALLSVEGDEQVGRVTRLHSAAIGYSSVIFGNIYGESEMVDTWREVWQNLEKDNSLPQKLEQSNRVLNWFIEIKEAHGSVEVTSLKQVDAIKDRGIFKVGNSEKTAAISHQLNLQDVIWLHVPAARIAKDNKHEEDLEDSNSEQSSSEDETEENDQSLTSISLDKIEFEGEGRDYTLGEMTDLQSRLMLVTGKADAGRESIERFTAIFDNVTRLGKVFLQLHASGCILFKQWTFEFHCNPHAGSSVMIRMDNRSVVKGTNVPENKEESNITHSNVNEYIRKIADFMESCYEEWIEYIAEKRNVFYPLNFYTVDQMVLLQEEIAKYRNGTHVTQFLCPLLSVVKSHCLLDPDLDDANNKVQENLLAFEQTSKMENESEKNTHTDAIRKFIKVAEETGISCKHALRAIKSQEFDIEDTDAGLIWCMSNDEKDDEEEYIQDNTSEINISAKDTTIGDKLREFMEELEENLRQQEVAQVILNLDVTWKKFLSCASSSATDFLSIDHLGMILDVLYKGENCILKRTLIDPLKCGKPNLIVCPQSEVTPMVLTIYMVDPNLPLPSRNEVLLCTDHTTKEEVDIFFRRALFQSENDQNERIFCLMNADKLQYDASEQSLKDVTEYIKSASGDYKLVIICSSENEYKSPMISALDKYRAPKIAVAGVGKIKEYLKKKYTPENISNSAADVDSIRHCVRVVKSEKAGMGKSLHKKRLTEKLENKYPIVVVEDFPLSVTIPLSQKQIDVVEVSNRILKCTLPNDVFYPRIFHLDIAYGVERFVGATLFNMLILGTLIDERGYVFHRSETDLFIVETTLPNDEDNESEFESSVQLLNILPSVRCISPADALEDNNDRGNDDHIVGFDEKNSQSDEYQRPYHYLMHFENRVGDIPVFNRNIKETDKKKCLQVLTRHCCVENPSWAELRNFIHFLNTQLQDFEKSVYCSAILKQDLPGFPVFVLRFLIQMSKDFSTRSLDISEGRTNVDMRIAAENDNEPSGSIDDEQHNPETDEDIKQFQMRRKWETSAHPYLFFNPDQNTMTFIGFNIDKYSRSLVDQQTRMVLEKNIMSKQLWDALRANKVPLQENFDDLSREQKIERLCRVVGNEFPQDPDETYELTTDNVKKMMAIYMRFRCNIPVIVMGETGCGKTCLIKFLCSLQCPAGLRMNSMSLMKVHGGTTKKHIMEKVKQAESLAESNCREHGKHIITVLFFDEANTTEAVGCIKEIMCDGTIDGKPLALNTNLKLVAACNPYRKHSDEMIDRLERAGLGYHVNSDETDDKLGRIPMRHLVYRVQPLPQSMLPLVWDFGQLDNNVEKLYIIQMVQRCVRNGTLPPVCKRSISLLSDILSASQEFMRNQKDECSFVSLRDVERTLKVFGWMYNQTEIFHAMDEVELEEQSDDEDLVEPAASRPQEDKMTKALLLALGVCYHSSLKSRVEYRKYITEYFNTPPLNLLGGAEEMEREITRCQMAFLQNLKLNDNIAKNLALRENFFMMVVCVELRIPLFLVGKPGSSKSLSKTILDHNMQGRDSDTPLFKSLKQVQLISFQCSPLATADGILKTFHQASSFQKSKNLEKFVSVVVLDEVGLAEDSPRMPLKALHPLLEDGCPDDEEFKEYKKVSFIGISNWALDPAKMNRGILVQREVPDEEDLIESARGICAQEDVYLLVEDLIPNLAQAYLHVFNKACNSDTLFRHIDDVPSENILKAREFFGLRDFYSLVKMICAVAVENRLNPTPQEIIIAIKRNFGGLEGLDPVQEFGEFLPFILQERPENRGVKTDTALLRECLQYEENKTESRYILLLTENYGALNLLHQLMGNEENTHVIFGSSFPRDQEYIEICRNINRIKVFMETGKTVVLLNLENLYESLYDALNQYYMESGPDRYIDLGLGTHRVKCKVDKKFRLVVVAEKRVVYKEFPIPLINRMEKHFLTVEGMLTDVQLRLSQKLEQWAKEFSSVADSEIIRIEEVFIGYNKDTAAGVVLKAWEVCSKNSMGENDSLQHRVLEAAKNILLWGCTPDAVLRLNKTEQEIFAKQYMQVYFKDQCHESLCDFLQFRNIHDRFGGNFIQITTHSKLMSETDKQGIERKLPFLSGKVSLLSLQAFDTEQQFSNQIRDIMQKGKELLLIQCDTGDENSGLVECARHCVQRELQKQTNKLELCVVFLVHLSRVSKSFFSGFQTGLWTSVHIDELRLTSLPCIQDLMTKSISAILQESLCSEENFSEEVEYESDMLTNLQERHVNLRAILFNCIHPALASITEADDSQERSIKRIKFIFKELNKSKQLKEGRFGYCLMKHIVTVLSKHSADSILYNDSWIQSEAAMSTSVNKTGTLRASCQRIIEDRVTPLLAKIVAFVDTNNNLLILESSDCEVQWLTDLWLGIFNSVDVENLTKIKVPQVMNTGANNMLSASFPFSWLIYEAVEQFLLVTSENAIGKSAEELFQESEIGNFFIQHLAVENQKEATRLYMSDFVKMSHKASCSREEMIVCEFLHICFESNMVGEDDNFISRVFCIHKTFKNIKPKLEIFSEVMCFVPQGDGSFYQKLESDIKELDITAVKYLLEAMEPNKTSIDTPHGQTQWIENVQRYRPVIERLLHMDFDKTSSRGRLMIAIRSRWTKIVVLKLFIQNLCINTTREKLMAQTCKILWKILGDNINMKEKPSLENLEKFLKASNKKAMTEFLGKFGKCDNCDKLFDSSPPVLLPCGHRICREDCFSIIVQMTEAQKLCPVNRCSQRIPENFNENETPENQKEQMKLFNNYQERCNKFYMQVVSQLCFENSTPPSEKVVLHLLELIIHKKTIPQLSITIIRTRQMTIFETVVDTTPVFRSFLLQLLIRTSEEAVFQHLEEFLRETDNVLQVHNKNHELELCLLLMQCFEDSLVEQAANLNQDLKKEATFVKQLLSSAIENLQSCSAVIDKLRNVATARYCLQTTAKYLRECSSLKRESNGTVYEEIFRMTAVLCDLPINHIRIFLLTHICRAYGLDLYQSLLKSNKQWLFPTLEREDEGMQESPDYCVVLGDTYKEIRDDVAKMLLVKKKQVSLKITERSASVQIFYLLVLIKEMKVRELFSDVEPIPKQFVESLKREFARKNLLIVQQYLDNVLEDSFANLCKQLQIQYHRDIRGQGIVILLLHFLMVLKTFPSNNLLQPLFRLATNPISLKGSFLPTMPEEVLSAEIKNELQRMEEIVNKKYHKVTWYRCRNGHPYAVGDCGNPTEVGRCYQCNAEIGGQSSKLRDDNARDTGADFSQPGHVLGSAEGRSTQATSERTLSPSSNILLRLLTHMAMFIGANEHSDDICQLIQPAIPTCTVPDFLWAHFNKDIDTLQVSLDRSLDDIFMFLHSTIHSFLEGDTSYSGIAKRVNVPNQYDWFSKEGRSAWETAIDRKILSHLLQERQKLFEKSGEILSSDKSMGSDPILREVFKKDVDSGIGFSTSNLQSSPHVWQYRTKVTFEHFVQEFYVMKNTEFLFRNPYLVLEKFLQQECHLRHLRHVPNILQMLRILITKYGKQITREEAETMTLQDCVNQFRNDTAQKIVVAGFTSFCELWNALRHMLITFYDAQDEIKRFLGRDINKESANIRAVLPDIRGFGACSRILLEFLIGKQNEFVTACDQSVDPRFSIENAVTMKNVTAMQLISFNREADIFPVILANCNYTYMQEESTKLEYDFENIQAVLQDRFLFGKPLIDTSKEFPLMPYKADTSLSMKFNILVTKIPQEALNKAVQSQIAEEFADLPELYVTIGNIDVVVNFLLSVHSSGEVLLNSFMVETLQMKPLPSSKASQCCKLSHVQSLWFLLFHEKTKRLHYSEKEAFDSMSTSIQESLPENCVLELDSYLNELSLEKLEILLEQLMECIIFSLNCGEGDIVSFQYSLSESLMVNLENGPYPEVDLKTFRREDVEKIPASILTVHAVEVWKKIHRTVRSRK